MKSIWLGLIPLLSLCVLAQQQTLPSDGLMRLAVVEHGDGSAKVKAHQARPLQSALSAVALEYGWILYFEDPPYYSHYDVVDATDPEWRKSHPGEKGALRIAGEAFESHYREGPDIRAAAGEETTLKSIVSDYNASGNPGKFVVRRMGEGYAVIGRAVKDENGRDQEVSAVLDTPISVPRQTRDPREAVKLILTTLSAATKRKFVFMSYPSNIFGSAGPVDFGGKDMPARKLLAEVLGQTCTWCFLQWDLLYDPDMNAFSLLVNVPAQAKTNAQGYTRLVPVRPK
jgi:hypothetical protein